MQQDLRQAVESIYLIAAGIGVGRTFTVAISGVAVAHAQDAHGAFHRKVQAVARSRDKAFLPVLQLHPEHGHVAPVGFDYGTVGRQDNAGRLARGLHRLRKYLLASVITHGFHRTGLVDHLPRQVPVLGHGFAFQPFAVDRQLHFVAIAVNPDIYRVSFVACQVPVGQDVQHGLVRPPSLQVVSLIFREAAIVQDAELRARSGKLHRVRLAAVVETGPVEQAGQIGTLVVKLPAALDAVQ